MLLIILCVSNLVSGVHLFETQTKAPPPVLESQQDELEAPKIKSYPQLIVVPTRIPQDLNNYVQNTDVQNYSGNDEISLPTLHHRDHSNCENSNLVVKIWSTLRNFLKNKIRDYVRPDNPNDFEMQKIMELIKDHQSENPTNAQAVHIYDRLVKLQTELNKAKEDLMNNKDTIRTSNNMILNPYQKGKKDMKTKIVLKYELPTVLQSNCKEAFLNLVESAYKAYLQLLKNPLCRETNKLTNPNLSNYDMHLSGIESLSQNQPKIFADYDGNLKFSYIKDLNPFNKGLANYQDAWSLYNNYETDNNFKTIFNELYKNKINPSNQLMPTEKSIEFPVPQSNIDISESKLVMPLHYVNNIPYKDETIDTQIPETNPDDSRITEGNIQVNTDKHFINKYFIKDQITNNYPTVSVTKLPNDAQKPESQINAYPNFNNPKDFAFYYGIQNGPETETKDIHLNPNELPNQINNGININSLENTAQLNTAQLNAAQITVPDNKHVQNYLNKVYPLYHQKQATLYENRNPDLNLYNYYQNLIQNSLNKYQLGNLKPHKMLNKNADFLTSDLIGSGVTNYGQTLYYQPSGTDNIPNVNDLFDVTNPHKLNTSSYKTGVIELTYLLKRQEPLLYQPYYFVKYRLPYNTFLNNIFITLARKPHLRSNLTKLYKEMISHSNVTEVSGELNNFNEDVINNLVFKNGTLIKAKVINETEENSGSVSVEPDKNMQLFQSSHSKLRSGDGKDKEIANVVNTTDVDANMTMSNTTEINSSKIEDNANKSRRLVPQRNGLSGMDGILPLLKYNHVQKSNAPHFKYQPSMYSVGDVSQVQTNFYNPGLPNVDNKLNNGWIMKNSKLPTNNKLTNPTVIPENVINHQIVKGVPLPVGSYWRNQRT